jgi:capsular polysaccharide biosynthesis protein
VNNLLGPVKLTTAALCLVIALIAAAAAYEIGHHLTATYAASGTIRVALSAQGGVNDQDVIAQNDLATQYSQLVNSPAVERLAAKQLGVPVTDLNGALSGSTLDAQNILQVTATGATSLEAEARARAGVEAVTAYLTHATQQQAAQYLARLQHNVKTQIPDPYPQLNTNRVTRLRDNLVGVRAGFLGQGARDAAGDQPTLQLVNPGGAASETAPKPKLYALVAFVVALIVTARVAFMISRTTEA